jgi:hypothetical protein
MKPVCLLFVAALIGWTQRLPTTGVLTLPCSDTSGSATAQSCSTSPSYTIAATNCINYTTTTSNTGDLTVAVNGGSAAHVRKWLGASVLALGDMPANVTVLMCFDGTYWEPSTIGNAPSGGGGSAFSSLTGGTNSTASMVVGTGASLAPSGSGTIQATALATVGGLPSQTNATFVANVSGGSASPTAASLPTTANALVKTNNANGALAASSVTDNGTTVTTTEPVIAASFSSGSSAPSLSTFTGSGGLDAFNDGTCTWSGSVPSGGHFICDNSGVPLWMSSSSSTTQLVQTGGALGTPASGVMTNMTGLPGHQIAASLTCADSSGSGTAQSCTTSPSFTPAANDCTLYTTTTTNSGTGLTTNIDSLGAKSIAIPGSSGWTTTLTASIIPTGKPLLMCYDGTNWNIQQTGTASSGGGSLPTGTAGQTVYYASGGTTVTATGPVNGLLVGPPSGSNYDFVDTGEKIALYPAVVQSPTAIGHVIVQIGTDDATGGDVYDIGLYGPNCAAGGSCPLVAHTGGTAYATTGVKNTALTSSVTLLPGFYYVALTGNASTAQYVASSYVFLPLSSSNGTATTATAGVLPSSITLASAGASGSQYPAPGLLFY